MNQHPQNTVKYQSLLVRFRWENARQINRFSSVICEYLFLVYPVSLELGHLDEIFSGHAEVRLVACFWAEIWQDNR